LLGASSSRSTLRERSKAFGFEKMLVVPEGEDRIAHAQLSFGNGMVMLGSVSDNAYGRLLKQPDEIGGVQTQTIYAIVTNPDAVYAQAKAVGVEIVIDIKDEGYGGRGFTCRDLEVHVWTFGSYTPW